MTDIKEPDTLTSTSMLDASASEFLEMQKKLIEATEKKAKAEIAREVAERERIEAENQTKEEIARQRKASEDIVTLLQEVLTATQESKIFIQSNVMPVLDVVTALLQVNLEVSRTLINFLITESRNGRSPEDLATLEKLWGKLQPNIVVHNNPMSVGDVDSDNDVNIGGR